MKKFPDIRNFDEFRNTLYAFRLPRVLLSAVDLDLFTVMGQKPWTVGALAKALRANERGLEILCRNLASLGLLGKQGTRYRSRGLGRTVLNAKSAHYCGATLDLMRQQWDNWAQLTSAIRSGKPVEDKAPETPESRRSFSWAMHERSLKAAKEVASQLDLTDVRSLLDLGGGPGTYALAFLAKNPHLQATVMDRPAALDVAKEIAASEKHGSRLSCVPIDFFQERISGKFDVVWLSNIIHIYSPAENKRLFKKIFSVLQPKGRLYIQDTFLLDFLGLRPQEANLFAVTMLLFTESGNTYKARDVHQWLLFAGFKTPKNYHLKEGTGDWDGVLVTAHKP